MASTLKKFLPPGWDDVAEGDAIVKSANGVVGGTLSTAPVLVASRALISDSLGNINFSTTTSTELVWLSGVTSAIQPQLDKLPQSIRVAYAATTPTKVSGHANLGVAAFPGDSQFRITHSQGNTNFAVQVQRINSIISGGGVQPLLTAAQVSPSHVTVTSTYIDVWFLESDLAGFQVLDVEFFLTLFPY
jgi:hypothetical protein